MSTKHSLGMNGAWSIHQRPRAIYGDGKTFVGALDDRGRVTVIEYDHDVGSATSTRVGRVTRIDDHSSPALHLRDDGRLGVYWTDRGNLWNYVFWAISEDEYDSSSFGKLRSFAAEESVDYPMPIRWNGGLRLYYRLGGHAGDWAFRTSTDDGETFGEEGADTDFKDSENYRHAYRYGDQLHFAMGDYRMDHAGIYHWYVEDGAFHRSDGTAIHSTDRRLSEIPETTRLFDERAKQYDLLVSDYGPTVVFTEHVATGTGAGDGDYRARWARFDGSEWTVSEIVEMGGSAAEDHFYEGGLCLDARDPTTVYVSVETDERNGQIQEWTTPDDGATWEKVRNLSPGGPTLGDPTKRMRPISPRNHNGELRTLWFEGRYDYWDAGFETQIAGALESN